MVLFFFYCHSCVDHSDCRSIFLEASDDVTVLVVPPRHLCVALEWIPVFILDLSTKRFFFFLTLVYDVSVLIFWLLECSSHLDLVLHWSIWTLAVYVSCPSRERVCVCAVYMSSFLLGNPIIPSPPIPHLQPSIVFIIAHYMNHTHVLEASNQGHAVCNIVFCV